MEIVISPSAKKKLDATIKGTKRISFGCSNYSGFTKNEDSQRKYAYLAHHKKEDWSRSNI